MKTQAQIQMREQGYGSKSETRSQSWASFPKPQGWAMEWDAQGLNHNTRPSQEKDNSTDSKQG